MTKITISGSEFEIRHATINEIEDIKRIFDEHKTELGFVIKSALVTSIGRAEVLVTISEDSKIIGVLHYRHRIDGQTTIYSIVVTKTARFRSLGRSMLNSLVKEALVKGQRQIVLKCPEELPANDFYRATNFRAVGIEAGKHRRLNIWQFDLRELSEYFLEI